MVNELSYLKHEVSENDFTEPYFNWSMECFRDLKYYSLPVNLYSAQTVVLYI